MVAGNKKDKFEKMMPSRKMLRGFLYKRRRRTMVTTIDTLRGIPMEQHKKWATVRIESISTGLKISPFWVRTISSWLLMLPLSFIFNGSSALFRPKLKKIPYVIFLYLRVDWVNKTYLLILCREWIEVTLGCLVFCNRLTRNSPSRVSTPPFVKLLSSKYF